MKKLLFLILLLLITANLFSTPAIASWYTADKKNALTANGEIFDNNALSAAHKTLTFGSIVKVSYGDKSVQVRINDRGPYIEGRDIDLTPKAAKELGIYDIGVAQVDIEIISEPEKPETKYLNGNETGWYTLQIGSYTNTKNAYAVYNSIKEAGLKPSVEIVSDGLIRISVKYVQSYRLESVMKTLAEIGITEPLVKGEANPYN